MKLVVSDTSPLRALYNAQLLHLLEILFDEVVIPPAVHAELTRPASSSVPIEPSCLNFCTVAAPTDLTLLHQLTAKIDLGEAEAIVLAIELNADDLLIDERAARTLAVAMHVRVTGVIGILVKAKNLQLIPAVMPVLLELRNKFQFHLSSAILDEARELSGE